MGKGEESRDIDRAERAYRGGEEECKSKGLKEREMWKDIKIVLLIYKSKLTWQGETAR